MNQAGFVDEIISKVSKPKTGVVLLACSLFFVASGFYLLTGPDFSFQGEDNTVEFAMVDTTIPYLYSWAIDEDEGEVPDEIKFTINPNPQVPELILGGDAEMAFLNMQNIQRISENEDLVIMPYRQLSAGTDSAIGIYAEEGKYDSIEDLDGEKVGLPQASGATATALSLFESEEVDIDHVTTSSWAEGLDLFERGDLDATLIIGVPPEDMEVEEVVSPFSDYGGEDTSPINSFLLVEEEYYDVAEETVQGINSNSDMVVNDIEDILDEQGFPPNVDETLRLYVEFVDENDGLMEEVTQEDLEASQEILDGLHGENAPNLSEWMYNQ